MESTTRIDSAPAIISPICRESRMVAFETGRLLRNEHGKLGDGSYISPHVDQQWLTRLVTPSISITRSIYSQTD